MAPKNIMITGGLGYVGGRLSSYFADLGHQVFALSRSKTVDYPNITVLTNEEVLKEGRLKTTAIDVVIHLAAANEVDCSQNPSKSNAININGTLEWLNWSKNNRVGDFIYFSTIHVYARPLTGVFQEASFCIPNHPYSISHKSAEDYVLWYRSDFHLNTKIIRLSNSFGYPAFATADRWTLFVNDSCRQIAESRQFELYSNVLQHRDFISLTEVCLAIEQLIDYHPISSKDSIFNLSKGRSKTLLELAQLIKEVGEEYYEQEIKLIYDSAKSKRVKKVDIKNEKLKAIGWNPTATNDREEIKKTIAYFNNTPIH
jgi:UDP-glucose 4-epimerase